MLLSLPPFLLFFLAGLLVPATRGLLRSALLLIVPLIGLWLIWQVGDGVHLSFDVLGYSLDLYRVDRLSRLFGYLFCIASFLANLYSLHLDDREHGALQHASGIMYAGSAIGAVFAGDFITLFVFWELLALTSVFLIWARPGEKALRSGLRYLIFNVVSGVILLAGALVHAYQTGDLTFEYVGLDGIAGWLILLGFGIKAGFPLVHTWLTDSYPEATVTGTVFLSAFTTKVAVYALARGFPGTELLIYIGGVMTFFPIFFAVIENDLRRVLSYSMINQVGFMVVGVGLGSELALNGAVAHAFVDVIFKGLLFMCMGAVLLMTGRSKGSELGGLHKSMPITTFFCIIGALSISAFPLFSAFISKSMVMSAAIEQGHNWLWLFLLFASAGVLEHAGIKIPYFAFFAHDSGIRTKEPPKNMLFAMAIASVLCIALGSFPDLLYSNLPWPVDYHPYDLTHVLTQLQLLFFAVLGVVWLMVSGRYPPEERAINLDAEWFYRRLGPKVISGTSHVVKGADAAVRRSAVGVVRSAVASASSTDGLQGRLARSWPIGSMVLWVAVLLGAYLLIALV